MEKRERIRLHVEDFRDYEVHLNTRILNSPGFLGDISDHGMRVLVPLRIRDADRLKTDDNVFGYVRQLRKRIHINFQGKIVRTENAWHRDEEFLVLGIIFPESIQLPDSLYALSLALGA